MTNFSFLQSDKDFAAFAAPPIAAERILHTLSVTAFGGATSPKGRGKRPWNFHPSLGSPSGGAVSEAD